MMFAAVTALDCEQIHERCDLIPGLWDKIIHAKDEMFEASEELLKTIPARKLLAINHELQYTVCRIEIKPPSKEAGRDYLYVSRKSFVELLQRAIQLDCLLCDKTVEECKKCKLYKNIDACFPYLLEEPNDKLCPFAGVSKLEVRERGDD
jgi:hypothetical protein